MNSSPIAMVMGVTTAVTSGWIRVEAAVHTAVVPWETDCESLPVRSEENQPTGSTPRWSMMLRCRPRIRASPIRDPSTLWIENAMPAMTAAPITERIHGQLAEASPASRWRSAGIASSSATPWRIP